MLAVDDGQMLKCKFCGWAIPKHWLTNKSVPPVGGIRSYALARLIGHVHDKHYWEHQSILEHEVKPLPGNPPTAFEPKGSAASDARARARRAWADFIGDQEEDK